jgi:plastocyanin
MRISKRWTFLICALTGALTFPAIAAADVNGTADETPAQAAPLTLGQPASGAFNGSADAYDYLKFTARAGGTLTFTLDDTSSKSCANTDPNQDGCAVYAWLADATGNEIGTANGANTYTWDSQESWTTTFQTPGTYYVGLQDDGTNEPVGAPSYTIEASVVSPVTTTLAAPVEWFHAKRNQSGYYVNAYAKLGQRASVLELFVHRKGSRKVIAIEKLSDLSTGVHHLRVALPSSIRRLLASGHKMPLSLTLTDITTSKHVVDRARWVTIVK